MKKVFSIILIVLGIGVVSSVFLPSDDSIGVSEEIKDQPGVVSDVQEESREEKGVDPGDEALTASDEAGKTETGEENGSETGEDPENDPAYSADHDFFASCAPLSPEDIGEYDGNEVLEINGNVPGFTKGDLVKEPLEIYLDLDTLGRCRGSFASVCRETMPTEKRGSISGVKPTGWELVRYDDLIEAKYLYNRCHVIGYQLTGENDNVNNLITGTRFMNEAMIPFEESIAASAKSGNHVAYRSTPVFFGTELLARGVHLEALSIEDDGKSVCFNVFLYNVQPGIAIDYATGSNRRLAQEEDQNQEPEAPPAVISEEVRTETTDLPEAVSDPKRGDIDAGKPSGPAAEPQPEEPEKKPEAGPPAVITKEAPKEIPEKTPEVAPAKDPAPVVKTSEGFVLNLRSKVFHRPSCASVKKMSEANKDYSEESLDEIVNKGYKPCHNCMSDYYK